MVAFFGDAGSLCSEQLWHLPTYIILMYLADSNSQSYVKIRDNVPVDQDFHPHHIKCAVNFFCCSEIKITKILIQYLYLIVHVTQRMFRFFYIYEAPLCNSWRGQAQTYFVWAEIPVGSSEYLLEDKAISMDSRTSDRIYPSLPASYPLGT
jgi:hypothetical protein